MLLCGNFAKYMNTISVNQFVAVNAIVEVSKKVRANSNGYLYVTFIDSDNKAINVYLSKSLCEEHSEDEAIVKGFFKEMLIAEVQNSEGEQRIKLVHKESQRLDISDIL